LASSWVAGRRFMGTILSIDYSKSTGYCPSMKLGRNFHKALVASGFANLADGVFQVALPLLAVQLTRSPLLVAGVAVAARLPWLLAPVAGALADRLDRRQTMVRVNLVRTVLLGGLALAVAADLATLVMLYAVALLLGFAETLFDTSDQSLLPAIVPRDDLTRANSRLFAVEMVANTFVGPPLGGLLAAAGLAVAMGVPAVAYLAGAGCVALIAGSFRAAGGTAGPTRLRDDVAEGARFVWRHPVLRPLAIMLGVENMAFAAVYAVFVLFAVAPGPMGLSKAGFGTLSAALGVGALAGTWLAVPAERRLGRVRTLVLSVLLSAGSLVVPVVTARPIPVGASMALTGVGMMLWNVVTVSLRQRITPDRLLGRMNASYRLVGWGTMPLGALLGGVLAEALGLRPTFLVAAGITLATLVGFRWVTAEAVARAEAAEAPTG
jgi:MFS family permease